MWLDGGELAKIIRHERRPRGAAARPPEPRTFEQDVAWLNRVVDFLDALRRISWWL
jgi:Zn-finger nucleic acid-binding protein